MSTATITEISVDHVGPAAEAGGYQVWSQRDGKIRRGRAPEPGHVLLVPAGVDRATANLDDVDYVEVEVGVEGGGENDLLVQVETLYTTFRLPATIEQLPQLLALDLPAILSDLTGYLLATAAGSGDAARSARIAQYADSVDKKTAELTRAVRRLTEAAR